MPLQAFRGVADGAGLANVFDDVRKLPGMAENQKYLERYNM
jgi:hypothetical protein